MEQAHADEPPAVMDALEDVSVQLALADDGGREVNPAGVQLDTGDRLVAGPAQALQQQLLPRAKRRHQSAGSRCSVEGANGRLRAQRYPGGRVRVVSRKQN